jgi:hypothetical protein
VLHHARAAGIPRIALHTSCDLRRLALLVLFSACLVSMQHQRRSVAACGLKGCAHVLQGLGVILEVQRDLAEEFVYFQVSRAANSAPRCNIQHFAYMQIPVAKVPGMTSRLAR